MFSYGQDALPGTQLIVSEHSEEHINDVIYRQQGIPGIRAHQSIIGRLGFKTIYKGLHLNSYMMYRGPALDSKLVFKRLSSTEILIATKGLVTVKAVYFHAFVVVIVVIIAQFHTDECILS